MPLLDIRVESDLKALIKTLAEKVGISVSQVTRDLIFIGLDAKRQGGIGLVGPFGIKRPFTKFAFDGEGERIGVRVEEDLVRELKREFRDSARKSARQALRLGATVLMPKVEIVGEVLGIAKAVAKVKPKLKDECAKLALKELQKAL